MIVGTAGHIDHGKTSLVKALTGVDTDRLKEEKARGITIELGFAYWPRPGGEVVGFVDVPGHERLVHTMLAGATGIDFVLLVVAADDGVMPQTREHLAIIDLLGLERGLIVLSKCDLADEARRTEVAAQIRMAVAGTALAEADIVPVSAVTGEGLADLKRHLDEALAATGARAAGGRFRLAIDRVFSLAGAGTVVTGTVIAGTARVGDRVAVSPSGIEARVRSIHAQNRAAETGRAGDRCAIALTGADVAVDRIRRGEMLLDPALHAPTQRLDARLTVLRSEPKPLPQWMPVRLHHGAAEVAGRLVVLGDTGPAAGTTDIVQLVLEAPLAALAQDRFVLRDTSASRTIGGGTIVDLRAPERRRRTPERRAELAALAIADPARCLATLLTSPKAFVDVDAFARDRGLSQDEAQAITASLDLVPLAGPGTSLAMAAPTWRAYASAAIEALERYHQERPDQTGLGQERLRLALQPRLPAAAFAAALQRLVREGALVLDRSWARRPHHEVRFSPEEERIWQGIRPLLGGAERFRPPRVREIARRQSIDEAYVRRLCKLAARRGDLDEVAKDHFFLSDTVVEMADIARDLARGAADGRFAVIAFRDRLDNGRKVAIQILEFFDAQGLTMRRGDWRRINPHKQGLYSRARAEGPSRATGTGGDSLPVERPDFKSGEGRETALGGFDSYLLRHITVETTAKK